jgi:ribonuclease P protein component
VESAAEGPPAQFALSVPKKKFPKAVHRNRVRRLVREAWRLNKHKLYESAPEESGAAIAVMVLYTATEELPFSAIEVAMKQLIRRLVKKWKT